MRHTYYDFALQKQIEYIAVPTDEQWQAFWDLCSSRGVWKWKGEYRNEYMYDGTMWTLMLSDGIRTIESHGQNKHPRNFFKFVAAAYALSGSPVRN